MLLLTISGSLGVEFDREMFGELCLECIYLMVKGMSASDVLVKKNFRNYQLHQLQLLLPLLAQILYPIQLMHLSHFNLLRLPWDYNYKIC